MADEKQTLPVQAGVTAPIEAGIGPLVPATDREVRADIPWQNAPPGPPGAAIDPPPCVTPKLVAAQFEARTAAENETVHPPWMNPMDFCHVVSWQAPFKAVVPTPRTGQRDDERTFEPVHLGKETAATTLEKLCRDAGWKPPTEDQMRK